MNFNIKSNSKGFGTLSAIILFLLIESVCVGIVASVLYANKILAKSKLESEEELKGKDMMKWIGLMNNIRACADEIVLNDIVYS